VGRPTSSNARCIRGCQTIIDKKPEGLFTRNDVSEWCGVSPKYAYQVITYGVTQGYIDIAKKDYESSITYYQLRGAGKKWLTRRWGNASVGSHEQEPSGADVQACDGEHRKETHVRDSSANAISKAKFLTSLLSKTPSERAKFRRLWDSSST